MMSAGRSPWVSAAAAMRSIRVFMPPPSRFLATALTRPASGGQAIAALPEQPQTGLHGGLIVTPARARADFLKRIFQAHHRPVRAVGGHGLDDVGHGEDAR